MFLFGRGLFCGWMCPFGSLREAIYKVARMIGLKRFQTQLPQKWHDRLKWVKYAVFFGLLVVSMFSMGLAGKAGRVEPFKTTFLVGVMNRAWPYSLFVASHLGRVDLHQALIANTSARWARRFAMPSTFRWFGLKRKGGLQQLQGLRRGLAQAIDADGRIDHRECLHCLDCMVLYTDTTGCPPLAKEKRREGWTGDHAHRQARLPSSRSTPPRWLTRFRRQGRRAHPHAHATCSPPQRPRAWPALGAAGMATTCGPGAAGLGLSRPCRCGHSLAVAPAWPGSAAMGSLSSGAIIGWWFGWSVYGC